MKYNSSFDEQFHQNKPLRSRPSLYKLEGWTDTIEGYCNEASQLASCILKNRKYMRSDYYWAVSINVEKELSISDVKALWLKACRKLKEAGVTALWVREPSPSNHVNYHLVVAAGQTGTQLDDAIEQAMPERENVKWHKQIEPIRDELDYVRYILKAKVSVFTNGLEIIDKHARKRLMFRPGLNLRKIGTIGDFWKKSRKELWGEIKDKERRVSEGLERDFSEELAMHIHDMIGSDLSLQQVRRRVGYFAGTEIIEQWKKQLFQEQAA